jgi:hypothetical protein
MPVNRFKAIHASLCSKIDDLRDVSSRFCEKFQNLWNSGGVLTFDESVYGYQPKKSTKDKHEKKV